VARLWQAHARSGNRSLRVVLRSPEALLAERAAMVAWRNTRRMSDDAAEISEIQVGLKLITDRSGSGHDQR
jgi:hypothetical protein